LRVPAGKVESGAKFADYFDFSEPLVKLPSHRILALFRGDKEEALALEFVPDPTVLDRGEPGIFERQIANRFKIADQDRSGDCWLIDTVRLAWRTRMSLLLIGLPAVALGTWSGLKLFSRLDETGFRRVVLVLLLASGVALLLHLR
jgi:hypothetical protein